MSKSAYSKHEIIKEIIEWDIFNWSRALSYWESFNVDLSSGKKVLEIGSRNGGLSLYCALKGASVTCSDLDGPSDEAINKHKKFGVDSLINYEKINVLDINYISHFDVVIFKSVLGGVGKNNKIYNQEKAVAQMYKALKLGGHLLFVENLSASSIHQILRKNLISWGDYWRYITEEEMLDFLSDFNICNTTTFGILGTFGRNEIQKKVLGCIDKFLLENFLPTKTNYIISGVAVK